MFSFLNDSFAALSSRSNWQAKFASTVMRSSDQHFCRFTSASVLGVSLMAFPPESPP